MTQPGADENTSPPPASPPASTQSAQRVAGGMLLGCGILIAGLSGLCTLLAAGSALIDTSSQDAREFATMIPAVLIFGGIPVGIGVGMAFLGRYLIRTGKGE